MRRPAAFMATRSSTVKGRTSAFMWSQLCQLSLPEVAIGQFRMRNDKVGFTDAPLAEPDDIEIEGTWTPPFGPLPPFVPFDGLACLQEGPRLQSGGQQHHLVQVRRLLHTRKRC